MAKKGIFEISDAALNQLAQAFMEEEESEKEKIRVFLKKHNIRKYRFRTTDDLIPTVITDIKGSVQITKEDLDKDGHIPFKFGKVSGSFDCNDCELTSLVNVPDEVGDVFSCSGNKLESLNGCPDKVGMSFECAANTVEFTEEDIKKCCKVGWKVKTFAIKPVKVFTAGYEDFPTQTKVDKFRFANIDGEGIGLAFHVSSKYLKKKSTLVEISYWTKYGMLKSDEKANGLVSIPKEISDKLKLFVEAKIDIFLRTFHFDEIDWNNWDIPTSEKELYEGGYTPLDISMPDHPSLKMETMTRYKGDMWLDGTPLFELKVSSLFYK